MKSLVSINGYKKFSDILFIIMTIPFIIPIIILGKISRICTGDNIKITVEV